MDAGYLSEIDDIDADFEKIDKWFESLSLKDLEEFVRENSKRDSASVEEWINDISEEVDVPPKKVEIYFRRSGLGNSYVEDGKKAVMSQKRIDESIDDYGASRPDYAQKYITRISPEDFIDLTVYRKNQNRAVFDTIVQGDHGSTMADWDYVKALHDSRNPWLEIRMSTGEIIGHNGRHRIRALEMAGIESVEIEVQFFDDDGRVIKTGAEIIPDLVISSQFDTATSTHISNIIPFNESFREDIEKYYGEKKNPKAAVRYSMEPTATVESVGKSRFTEEEVKLSEKIKHGFTSLKDKLYIDTVDELWGVEKYLTKFGKRTDTAAFVQQVRAAETIAQTMIGVAQYDITNEKGERLGDGGERRG